MENIYSAIKVLPLFCISELIFIGFGSIVAKWLDFNLKSINDRIDAVLFCFLISCVCLPLIFIVSYFFPTTVSFIVFFVGLRGCYLFLVKAPNENGFLIFRFLAFSCFFLLLTSNYWATNIATESFVKIDIYDDLFSHLQRQHFSLFQYSGGPIYAAGGYPSYETKGSNLIDFISIILLKPFIKMGVSWDLNLGMCLFTISAKYFFFTIYSIIRKFRFPALRSPAIACIIFALLFSFTYGSAWFLSLHIPSINNGFSILLLLLYLRFFFGEYQSKQLDLIYLMAPVLLWSRLSWALLYLPLLGTFFLAVLRYANLERRDLQVFKTRNILLLFYSVITCGFVLLNNKLFGNSPVSILLNSDLANVSKNYLEYLRWYPHWLSVSQEADRIFSFSGLFVLELAITFMCGEVFRVFTSKRLFINAAYLSFFIASIAMFVIVPCYDDYHFGSAEPLGSLGLLRINVMALIFILVGWKVAIRVDDLKIFRRLAPATESAEGRWGVVVTVVIWVLLSQTRYDHAIIAKTRKLEEVKSYCEAGDLSGIYVAEPLFKVPGYEGKTQQGSDFSSSIIAASVGCLSIGEERYSLKHSSSEDRIQYQKYAKIVYEALTQKKPTPDLEEYIAHLRGKKIGIVSFSGDFIWK